MIFTRMMFADRPPEALAEHLGFLMNWLAIRSRRAFVAALTPLGLDPRQYGLLVIMTGSPGATQQELAQRAEIDPSSMVALIDELEAAGLAERRPHSDDRRKRAIHLTAGGERALVDARAVAEQLGEDLTAPLTRAEAAELMRLLRKITGLEDAPS
jgi:DNA-binding MarR family transcriptional regulator